MGFGFLVWVTVCLLMDKVGSLHLGQTFSLVSVSAWVVKSWLLTGKFRGTSTSVGFSAVPFGAGFLMDEV